MATSIALLSAFLGTVSLCAAGLEEEWGQVRAALVAGQASQAQSMIWELVIHDRDSITVLTELARELAAEGRQEITGRVLVDLGRQGLAAADYALTESLLAAAVEISPSSSLAWSLLGQTRALDRKWVSAEQPLRRAVELGRADLKTLLYLGSTLWENGRIESAVATLRQAVEVSGRSPVALHQLGRLLLWRGDFAESAAVLAEVMAKRSATPDLMFDLARALAGADREEEARAAFEAVIEAAPEYSQAHYCLAELLLRSGEIEAGRGELEVYRSLVEAGQERVRAEGLAGARLARAQDLLRRDEARRAIELLEQMPATADSLALLAMAYESNGDRAGSLRALERAVALAPERSDLRARLNQARLAQEEE